MMVVCPTPEFSPLFLSYAAWEGESLTRLVGAPHIQNDVAGVKDLGVSAPHYLRVFVVWQLFQ